MLKPMKPKKAIPNNIFLWVLVGLLVLSGIIALISAFSGGDSGEDEVNAVYTNAAATLEAQQLTLEASAPSATPTVVTSTPTITVTPLASPTLFPTIASSVGTTGGTGTGSFAVGCNNSVFVTDVTVPDDTAMTPGQTFTKTWRLQNNGTCAWTTAYKVSFVSGSAMGASATPLTAAVQPGQSGDISVSMTAPATAGDAIGYWILTNDSGQNFGSSFYVKIKVGAAASTTGTATATATTAISAPAAPTDLNINSFTCNPGGTGTQYEYAGELTWTDKSDNETGFRIYINGNPVATVSEGINSYALPSNVFYDLNSPTFAVEAFVDDVKSAQASLDVSCP